MTACHGFIPGRPIGRPSRWTLRALRSPSVPCQASPYAIAGNGPRAGTGGHVPWHCKAMSGNPLRRARGAKGGMVQKARVPGSSLSGTDPRRRGFLTGWGNGSRAVPLTHEASSRRRGAGADRSGPGPPCFRGEGGTAPGEAMGHTEILAVGIIRRCQLRSIGTAAPPIFGTRHLSLVKCGGCLRGSTCKSLGFLHFSL